uniref:Uncharacterized protein n=1 Tax=Parascaris equorum TaxID=6256 RepID=A0A914RK92_PAREQ
MQRHALPLTCSCLQIGVLSAKIFLYSRLVQHLCL